MSGMCCLDSASVTGPPNTTASEHTLCRSDPPQAVLLEACSGWYAYDFILKALQATDHRTLPLKELLAMEVTAQVRPLPEPWCKAHARHLTQPMSLGPKGCA